VQHQLLSPDPRSASSKGVRAACTLTGRSDLHEVITGFRLVHRLAAPGPLSA